MAEIGLFPLAIVLVPGERVPLHIFEPRYRELIGECLDRGGELGLVLEDGEGTRSVGTTAAVVEVIERHEDGTLDVVVEGRERFRLEEETAGRSFRTARIELLSDASEEPPAEGVDRCLAAYRTLAEEAGAAADEPPAPVTSLAFWISARVDFGVEAKQELLELDSERERITRLTGFLERARTAVRFSRTASERARTNGRVEPPG